jgi:hypothetical protein
LGGTFQIGDRLFPLSSVRSQLSKQDQHLRLMTSLLLNSKNLIWPAVSPLAVVESRALPSSRAARPGFPSRNAISPNSPEARVAHCVSPRSLAKS